MGHHVSHHGAGGGRPVARTTPPRILAVVRCGGLLKMGLEPGCAETPGWHSRGHPWAPDTARRAERSRQCAVGAAGKRIVEPLQPSHGGKPADDAESRGRGCGRIGAGVRGSLAGFAQAATQMAAAGRHVRSCRLAPTQLHGGIPSPRSGHERGKPLEHPSLGVCASRTGGHPSTARPCDRPAATAGRKRAIAAAAGGTASTAAGAGGTASTAGCGGTASTASIATTGGTAGTARQAGGTAGTAGLATPHRLRPS